MNETSLLRYRKNLRYCVFDGESCSLNLMPGMGNLMWQLSWMVVENGQVIDEQNRFLWHEDLKMSPDAARVTRFDYDSYKNKAEDARKVYDDFSQIFYGEPETLLCGHNLMFDHSLIKILERKLGIQNDKDVISRIYCTHAISKMYKLGLTPPKDKEDYPAFQFSILSIFKKGLKTNLKEMARTFDILYDETRAHDAGYDIWLTNELFKQLIWKVEI